MHKLKLFTLSTQLLWTGLRSLDDKFWDLIGCKTLFSSLLSWLVLCSESLLRLSFGDLAQSGKKTVYSTFFSEFQYCTWIFIPWRFVVSIFSLLFTYFLYIGALILIGPVSVSGGLRIWTVRAVVTVWGIAYSLISFTTRWVAFWWTIFGILLNN